MKPLTAAEVEAYKKSGIASESIQAMMDEVEKINKFIEFYRRKNAPLARLDELMKTLSDHKLRAAAIKKINDEIEKAIDLITDNNQLKIVDAETNDCNGDTERPFLYTALKSFDVSKIPCGEKGSVDERIKDCAKEVGANKDNYSLVSRTAKGQEVWKDTKSGLVWSDRIASSMSHDDAQKACKNGLPEMVGISSDWKLPTRDQYDTANANGIRGALPKMGYWYWFSSEFPANTNEAYLFNGVRGYFNKEGRSVRNSVRCVAK